MPKAMPHIQLLLNMFQSDRNKQLRGFPADDTRSHDYRTCDLKIRAMASGTLRTAPLAESKFSNDNELHQQVANMQGLTSHNPHVPPLQCPQMEYGSLAQVFGLFLDLL